MIDLGLTNSEHRELIYLLSHAHALRIRIEIMDLNHNSIGIVSNRFLSGSVDIDAEAEVTRSLKLSLLDADRNLNLDKDNPNQGAMYLDRMIQVHYGVGRLDGAKWYDIPVFTGPITKVDRDGVVVNVECKGKESLAKDAPWKAKSFGKMLRTTLVRRILQMAGETRFRFDTSGSKTGSQTAVKKKHNPFDVAKKVAAGSNLQLFYDGLGRARLRRKPSRAVFVFNETNVIDMPQVGYTMENVVNAVEVKGEKKPPSSKNQKDKKKKEKDRKFTVRVVADRNHPLSPWSLQRGGTPRYIPLFIEDTNIRTKAEASQVAKRELARGLIESIDASFVAFPNPLLEEGDLYSINLPTYAASATVKKITLPLHPGQGMSVGYTRRVRPSRLARKTRRR